MTGDEDEIKTLRELLAQIPLVEVEAMAFDEEYQANRREVEDWAAQTIAVAKSIGRDDIVERVDRIVASTDQAVARLQAATAHREEQTRIAEETLNRLDAE